MIYVDKLDIYIFFKIYKKLFSNNIKIFYFENNINNLFIYFIKIFLNISFEQIDIELKDSVNLSSDWYESKIRRNEFIKFKNYIDEKLKSENFSNLDNFKDYFIKSIINYEFLFEDSSFRYNILYLKKIILHKKINEINQEIVYLKNIPWDGFYRNYGLENNLNIIFYNSLYIKLFFKNFFKELKYNIKKIIKKYISIFFYFKIKPSKINSVYKIAFENLGEISFGKDFYNNDFFFNYKHLIKNENIAVEYSNYKEMKEIIQHNMHPYNYNYFAEDNKDKFNFKFDRLNVLETKQISKSFHKYSNEKNKWNYFFNKMNIKIYLTWNKFNQKHLAIYDAIKKTNGVLAIWERSFEGVPSLEFMTKCDIIFKTGNINLVNSNIQNDSINYTIKVGFLREYSKESSKKIINNVRGKILDSGAKKIISFFDQNSQDPYMHSNQRECYEALLKFVLNNNDAGLVLKPKKPKTLFSRLGKEFKYLYEEAYRTNRVFLFSSSGKYQSNVSVNTAALCSDLCIHSNLYAATAGIECALSGIPTLILDREKDYSNVLYKILNDKIIIPNIDVLIRNLNQFFNNSYDPDLGNWSKIINEIDPYRDGKGIDRLNWYLNFILNGYIEGIPKNEILLNAAKEFANIWGKDKVIINNNEFN